MWLDVLKNVPLVSGVASAFFVVVVGSTICIICACRYCTPRREVVTSADTRETTDGGVDAAVGEKKILRGVLRTL